MWFLRSRSRSLFSHLHAVRRSISHPVSTSISIAAKRGLVSDASDGNRLAGDANGDGRRTPGMNRQQHLYLLLDDTKDGFGIHKVHIDDNNDDDDVVAGTTTTTPERLSEPPLLRIEYPTLGDHPFFAVLGSNIIGMGSASTLSATNSRTDGVTLAFDTKTAALSVVRDCPYDVCHEIAVAAANRLYLMDSCSSSDMLYDRDVFCDGGLHCLKLLEDDADPPGSSWSWYTYSDFSDLPARWLWSGGGGGHHLLPLSPNGIRAHALHPGGRTFFVSVHCWIYTDHRGRGTLSYDTERDEWTRHGDWELPFLGQAHYDGGMRAWVGLHARGRSGDPDGHLCACDVPHLDSLATPRCEVCKDQLFPADPKRHIDAKLVPMGGGGRFCLVEILMREGVGKKGCLGDGDKCLVRLTAFRVRRGDNGELTITARRPAGEYKVSRYVDRFEVQAFWM